MITATCTGCGDAHLCPGTTTPNLSQPLLDILARFTEDTFDPDPVGYVSSNAAYLAYLNWCTANTMIPISQRKFIPAMSILGYPRVKRSTMRLAGLRFKEHGYWGRHHNPQPANRSPWFTPRAPQPLPAGPNRGPFRDTPPLKPAVPGPQPAGSSPTRPGSSPA